MTFNEFGRELFKLMGNSGLKHHEILVGLIGAIIFHLGISIDNFQKIYDFLKDVLQEETEKLKNEILICFPQKNKK